MTRMRQEQVESESEKMSEERLKILELIQNGTITAEEGARLLEALGRQRARGARGAGQSAGRAGIGARYLRVRVTHLRTDEVLATVRLPWRMVRALGRIASGVVPEIMGIDLEEIVEAAEDGREGRIIEAVDESENKRVEIFIER